MADRPATEAETEKVTPAMRDAGALVLLRRFNLDAEEEAIAEEIYRAMDAVRRDETRK